MRKTVGILAHVDAGKTSFSEQILYRSGAIRNLGRVDHRDAFLDAHPIERERGITVFSDQAVIERGENRIYWLDTPGHADFAAEMERAISAMDFAVLLVSCMEGVESHTETIWQLLREYAVPTLIFVNKTDRPEADFDACLRQMRRLLSGDVADFRGFDGRDMDERAREAVAERDEAILERYLSGDYEFEAWRRALSQAVAQRRVFPAFAGSALTGDGVDSFLAAMDAVTDTDYAARESLPFAARVYKLRHDASGGRRAYLKIEQGALRPRDAVETPAGPFKINEIKFRHGERDLPAAEARAGDLVCVPGLPGVRPGDHLGAGAPEKPRFRSEALIEVNVEAPGTAAPNLLRALETLCAEDPCLGLERGGVDAPPRIRVMGNIQMEILARELRDRFGMQARFGPPRILYMETICAPAVGVGHYEPLKHYAEVWLRLRPAPRGSGIQFESRCHVDELALNWQRLIETHVFERAHPGVLTGAPLTDVKIELLAGRAHLKHTEGGDFREASYRAIRNALMHAQCALLEPVVRFYLRLPAESYGRVAGDLNRMRAETEPPEHLGEWLRVEGRCAYREFAAYPETFRALTHGRGSLRMKLSHYAPAANAQEIIDGANYNPRAADSPDSVFCDHGAGHIVAWDEVRACAHCHPVLEDAP